MNWMREAALSRASKCAQSLLLCASVMTCTGLLAKNARAQEPGDEPKQTDAKQMDSKPGAEIYETLYLHNTTQLHGGGNEITTALRNMLPRAHLYYVSSTGAITLHCSPADMAEAKALIAALDKPERVYRLTYTVTEVDGDKRMGARHIVLVVSPGAMAIFKQGTRMPIMTGSYDGDTSKANTQFQYVDVGMNIEATVDGHEGELKLRSKIEESSVADEKSNVGLQDPVLRQEVLDSTTMVPQGKALVIGSFDVPGGTHRQEVEVTAELVK